MAALGSSLRIGPDGAGYPGVGPSPGWGYLDYPGASIVMRAETAVERRWRLNACQKEPWTAAWLETLGPGDLLFNIGACVGSYALIAAHRGALVVAVEASPINAARLAENAEANLLGTLVTIVLGVCGPTVEPYGVTIKSGIAGAADIEIGKPLSRFMLPGLTLDEMAEVYGQPTHLLIDVDGGELDVLRGGVDMLPGVREVMLEVSRDPAIAKGCAAILEGAGLPSVATWDQRHGMPIEGVTYSLHRRSA